MESDSRQKKISIRLQQGDLHALELIYQEFHAELFFYALKLTGQRSMAEDAVQDTFVNVWRYRKKLGPVKSLRFYLFRSLRHRSIKLLKSQHRFTWLGGSPHLAITIEPEELRLNDESEEVKARVKKALLLLSSRQREIVFLKFYENLTYNEIADLLDINYQSVVNHVHQAIQKLRKSNTLKYITD